MDVTVTDPLNPLRLDSLTEDKFILKLGVQRRTLTYLLIKRVSDPVSLVLMLDMSTSQTVNIDTIKLAAKSFTSINCKALTKRLYACLVLREILSEIS